MSTNKQMNFADVHCECTLTCHRVWRSAPALEYILAGRESVCGCINVCQAPRLRADLANGRRFHAAEMQPPLISAPACVRGERGRADRRKEGWVMERNRLDRGRRAEQQRGVAK